MCVTDCNVVIKVKVSAVLLLLLCSGEQKNKNVLKTQYSRQVGKVMAVYDLVKLSRNIIQNITVTEHVNEAKTQQQNQKNINIKSEQKGEGDHMLGSLFLKY